MKLQKYTKSSLSIIFTLLLSYGLVGAWTNLTSVTTGDSLTATVWNDMVTKLNDAGQRASGIFTDGSGNVGIGTNSPANKLNVIGNTRIKGNSNYTLPLENSFDLVLDTDLTNRSMYFLGNGNGYSLQSKEKSSGNNLPISLNPLGGNVGIGTTTPTKKLQIGSGNYSLSMDNFSIGTDIGNLLPGSAFGGVIEGGDYGVLTLGIKDNDVSDAVAIVSGNGNYMTDNTYDKVVLFARADGRVGIGTTTPTQLFHVNGTALATAWNTTSDIRKKENISQIQNSLEKISNLRGVNFTWKETKKQDVGVIAQEVEKQFPEFVTTDNEGYKSVDYGKLTAPLIEAVKELKKENDKKDKQIDELSKQNELILKRLEILESK
ncbi:MAG: tail fiber domain-containing protein [Candidatus Gracilibacteria bacterium]|nr:tail fiber domain-containing protein [Candidatus Gracilibacteria bacterium]